MSEVGGIRVYHLLLSICSGINTFCCGVTEVAECMYGVYYVLLIPQKLNFHPAWSEGSFCGEGLSVYYFTYRFFASIINNVNQIDYYES